MILLKLPWTIVYGSWLIVHINIGSGKWSADTSIRLRFVEIFWYNANNDHNEYPSFDAVAALLLPYVAERLLVWGAGMNISISLRGVLSYITKYITKPEPCGRCANTSELAMRNLSHIDRFLNARMIGAPKIFAIALHVRMKSRCGSVLYTTKLQGWLEFGKDEHFRELNVVRSVKKIQASRKHFRG